MLKQITRSEMIRQCAMGERFTLVDVLSKDSFTKEHIPGAVSIPLDELEARAGDFLRKDDTIIVIAQVFNARQALWPLRSF